MLKCIKVYVIFPRCDREPLRSRATCRLILPSRLSSCPVSAMHSNHSMWAERKRSGAGRKSDELERSGERTFQKTLERERGAWSGPRSGERAKSAAQSPLTPNIKDNRSLITFSW